jgi:leucyl aminopeptidase
VTEKKTPCLVVGIFEEETDSSRTENIFWLTGRNLTHIFKDKEFTGKHQKTLLLHMGSEKPCLRVLLVGLGKENEITPEKIRRAVGSATNLIKEIKVSSFAVDVASFISEGASPTDLSQVLSEGILLANYRFERYQTEKPEEKLPVIETVDFCTNDASLEQDLVDGIGVAQSVCEAVYFSRDLVNEPGNVKSPEYLAQRARAMAEKAGLKCTVLEKAELEKEGMGALLGVAQGSAREPRLIILEYVGADPDQDPVVLVGKGVVFDSGGISLKPADKMDEMKMDMAGGAAVLGTMLAVSNLVLPRRVVGIIPAVENLPSGTAIRPGDILTSMSGKTIEVLNTDAEGRLILADALTYAGRYNPRMVIDLATLTGACVVALGHEASAVLGNDSELIRSLIASGEEAGERLWELPLWDDYSELMKSEVADVKNSGGRPAGTISAAVFLKKFADDYKWAHLDIAGTARENKGGHYRPKGGTGFGVRLLTHFLKNLAD